MSVVYRMIQHRETDFADKLHGLVVSWHPTKAAAMKALIAAMRETGRTPSVERVVIPNSRTGLVRWLNAQLAGKEAK